MAYNNVHLPVGYEVAAKAEGDGSYVDLGVTANESTLEFTYDQVKVTGSQAESILNFVKNMQMNATFSLYQQDLMLVNKLLAGVSEYTANAGTPVADATQTIAADWTEDKMYLLDYQNASGAVPTIGTGADVVASTSGALDEEDDYFLRQVGDAWYISFKTTGTNTVATSESIVITSDYTPAASRQITAGSASVDITPVELRIRKLLETGKYYTVYIYAAVTSGGLSMSMPRYDADEPNILEITMEGQLDTSRAALDQLFKIVDEFGIEDNNDGS